MRFVLRFSALLFAILLMTTSIVLTVRRQSPLDDEWATLVITDPPPRAAYTQLQLLHPQTGYSRTVVTFEENSGIEYVHWSPDGEWVIVGIRGRPGDSYAYRVYWTGRDRQSISFNSPSIALSTAEWSPTDEVAIVFDPIIGNHNTNVYALSADGSQLTQIDSLDIYSNRATVQWSSDGTSVIVAATAEGGQTRMFRVRSDGQILNEYPRLQGAVDSITISPDGEWLGFSTYWPPQWSTVYRMRLDGSDLEAIITNDRSHYGDMWWSPDGTLMAVQRSDSNDLITIGRIDVAVGEFETIIDNITNLNFLTWFNDRSQLVAYIVEDFAPLLLVANADGSNALRIPILLCGNGFPFPIWPVDDKWLMVGATIGGQCNPYRLRSETGTFDPLLPSNLYQFDYYAPPNPNWYVFNDYNRTTQNLQSYFAQRETGKLVQMPGGRVEAWSPVPTQDQNPLTGIALGSLLIFASAILNWRKGYPH